MANNTIVDMIGTNKKFDLISIYNKQVKPSTMSHHLNLILQSVYIMSDWFPTVHSYLRCE